MIINRIKKNFISRAYLRSEINRAFFLYKADQMTQSALKCREDGVSTEQYFEEEIVLSLTTYGKRLYDSYLAIESIMQGTIKPNRIVLWLQEELKNLKLPAYLKRQVDRGLEIYYCKDIRSYKKLIPSLLKYPDASIITIDDDVIYREDMVEKLLNAHDLNKNVVCANKTHVIGLSKNNQVLPYLQWREESQDNTPSSLNFSVGVGGVLYPVHCFNEEVFKEEVFMSLCPNADDIWFYAMSVSNNYKTMKTRGHSCYSDDYYSNDVFQIDSLSNLNLVQDGGKGNDIQLKKVFDRYNIYKYLCRD